LGFGLILAIAFAIAPGTALAAEAPTVQSVDDASLVTYTSAHLTGSVVRAADPDPSSNAACRFEYVINAQFLGTGFKNATPAPCDVDPLTTPGPNPVEADITGLKPGATYHLRLTASNSAGASSLVAANTFTTTAIAAPEVTILAPTAVTAGSAHFSGEINPQLGAGPAELYEVEWRFQCSPECLGPNGKPLSGTPIPPDNANHLVAADAVLEPNTTYRVSLIAVNTGESATDGPVIFATDALPPLARTLGVSAGAASARLGGKVNPHNLAVEYQFQWGLTGAYGNLAPATPRPLATADNSFHLVAETIAGLQSQTTYHYRLVVTDTETGEKFLGVDRTFTTLAVAGPPAPCPNQSSRVGLSVNLPDCRAYELITPGLNNSAPAEGWPGISVQSVRADGSAVAFSSADAPDNAEGSTATTNTVLASRGPAGWTTKSLSAPTPLASGTDYGDRRSTVGLSADLSQSVLWTNQPLVGAGSPAGTNLYLRRADGSFRALTQAGAPSFSAGGELAAASQDFTRLFIVSTVKQLGTDPVAGGNTYEWSGGTLRLVTILPGSPEEPAPTGGSLPQGALPPVSDDGRRVLFEADGLPGLYLRSNGSTTVEVSATQRTVPDPNPPGAAIAAGIAADGSEVLFTSSSELTDDANTGETGGLSSDQGRDLYSYDVASGELTDLTVDTNPDDAATGANVEQVLGASRDASYVYFVARGALATGATSGERNLYVEHDGAIQFVASDPDPEPFYATPDGRHAAFVTTEPQTGYDNDGRAEAYKYSYGGTIECASCRPSGEPPNADATIAGRALSDDGSRMFFQSGDAVVPQAQSGQANVFTYIGGEPRLLTPGDGGASVLVGASASGDDVFIASFEELSPQGQGSVFAIYNARVNAEVPRPTTSPACQGETCRGVPPAMPAEIGVGTASFEAPGRVSAPEEKAVKGSKLQLRVIVPGRGELSVSGRGLVPVTKPVSKSGALVVTLALKKGADRKRQKNRVFRTEAEVLFRSSAGAASRVSASLRFEATAKRGGAK
jgi:hypothetical protein